MIYSTMRFAIILPTICSTLVMLTAGHRSFAADFAADRHKKRRLWKYRRDNSTIESRLHEMVGAGDDKKSAASQTRTGRHTLRRKDSSESVTWASFPSFRFLPALGTLATAANTMAPECPTATKSVSQFERGIMSSIVSRRPDAREPRDVAQRC